MPIGLKRDIFQLANSTVSFFVQALLGVQDKNGKTYESVSFLFRERGKDNKTIRSIEYHLGKDVAEIWGIDLAEHTCDRQMFEDEKKVAGNYKNIQIRPDRKDPKTFAVSIINGEKENRLWIRLTPDQRRALGRRLWRTIEDYERLCNEKAWAE